MSTRDPCFLRVDLLNSAQTEILATASVPCEAGLADQSVSVPFDSFPQSFYVQAVMETENGIELCGPVIFEDFYDPAAVFDELTPDDFASQTVLDFGSEGFAVLLDSVRNVEGTVSGDVYIIRSGEEIYPGDALYLPGPNDLVQAESVSPQGDDTYLVMRIIGTGLEPFFRFLNYEGKIDAVAGLGNTIFPLAQLNLSHCTQLGLISLGWCESMVIDVSCFRYDPEYYGIYLIDSHGNRQGLDLFMAPKACNG